MELLVAGSGCKEDAESKLRRRTDGRLDRSRDPAILNAALSALADHGYKDTSMNDIAARAGVGKAAIYRRWASIMKGASLAAIAAMAAAAVALAARRTPTAIPTSLISSTPTASTARATTTRGWPRSSANDCTQA